MTRLFTLIFGIMMAGDALAQEAGAPQGGGFASMIPLIFIFVIFYFLIIRPQSKKLKAHAEMVTALKKGDKVITGGGVEGVITKVPDGNGLLEVEIAKGVKVKVVRSTVTDLVAGEKK